MVNEGCQPGEFVDGLLGGDRRDTCQDNCRSSDVSGLVITFCTSCLRTGNFFL